jgi:predicted phage-related endonuclease
VAKLFGLSKWGGPLSVYLDKIGASEQREGASMAMQSGLRAQGMILRWYADIVGEPLWIAPDDQYDLVVSPRHPHLAASLDARWLRGDKRPVDAKNIRYQTAAWGAAGTDEIPNDYALQLAVQMLATTTPRADLAVLFSGQDMTIYGTAADERIETAILERVDDFWRNHVEPRIPPPPDASEECAAYLAATFKQADKDIVRVEAGSEADRAAHQLRRVRDELKRLEEQKALYENALKAAIGAHAGLTGAWGTIRWSQNKDTETFDGSGYAKELELIVAEARGLSTDELREQLGKRYRGVRPGARPFVTRFKNEED